MKKARFSEFRKFGVGLATLILSLFLLSACASGGLATPTAPVSTSAPQTATQTVSPTTPTPVLPPATSMPTATQTATTAQVIKSTPSVAPANAFIKFAYADSEYFVHIPAQINQAKPYQVVMTVHGMGGNGRDFGQLFTSYADENNFVLVAPTMHYDNNYTNPDNIAANDATLLPELHELINDLPTQLQHPVKSKVMLLGFSRGAQIVHRVATFYPEQVSGVVVLSAGNYTLPERKYLADKSLVNLKFPFGVADIASYTGADFNLDALRQVRFWIGVGDADTNIKDVPAAWNPYLGQTRVERATHYFEALQAANISASLHTFSGVGHTVCTEMKQGAFAFFKSLES